MTMLAKSARPASTPVKSKPVKSKRVEKIITLSVRKLPEGCYLGSSDDVQGLVVQADTVTELVEIAKDVAEILVESQLARQQKTRLPKVKKKFEYPLIVNF